MKDFAGRTCVVTGAASGIGRALALALADRGARLALSDVDEAGVHETATACTGRGAPARGYRVDVADRKAVHAHAEQVADDVGPAALVVNNAGVTLIAAIQEMSYDDMRWVVDVNFWGVVHGTQAFLPQLLAAGRSGDPAHLVNISSVFGLLAVPKQSAYCASKFAVRGFTEAVRQDLLRDDAPVAVSSVHPGGIKTAIVQNARVAPSEEKSHLHKLFYRVATTSAESAAAQILKGVERDRPRILVGYDALGLDLLPRVTGSRYQRLTARLMGRAGY
ncbi:MAG: SDR family NAD(P)-dependent oxidoreductase [Actinomycetota bacterium]|nr:SDR family NAD(P)-dependent oxidoreductase [Actinomycetota bacterium]